MTTRRRIGTGFAALLALALVLLAALANDHPSLARYDALMRKSAGGTPSGFTVTWLGVSTLLFDDGETAFVTDGFFSRPGKLRSAFGALEPDAAAIDRALQRTGVKSLAAVIPLHSHYDHALDAPLVARKTGALLVGSASTANIGRGQGLPEDRILTIADRETMTLGKFTLRFFRSAHVPSTAPIAGDVDAPLTVPAAASAFREGGCWTLLVTRGDRSVLVQSSAGFVDGALRGVHADVVYLGVGLLGKQDAAYRERYWNALVRDTGAQRVIPIHWDDFWRPLESPVVPLPRLVDDFDASMGFLIEHAHRERVDLELPRVFLRADPYAGQ
jgi:L-ascorbate metabolism protein UlaG (beta-lactamase superfamily)